MIIKLFSGLFYLYLICWFLVGIIMATAIAQVITKRVRRTIN